MHNVYVVAGETSEEAFRKEAYTRLEHGEGFTMFHFHQAETQAMPPWGPMPIPCTPACKLNDPYPAHVYNKADDAVARQPGAGTCAVYQHLDPLFYDPGLPPAGQHCLNCHCTCFSPETDLDLDDACGLHGDAGCPRC